MNKEIIIKTLIDNNYPVKQAEGVAEELLCVDSSLVPIVESWLQGGEEKDFVVENYSILGLKKKFDMTYPAALLTLDWIIKEPIIAIDAISRGIK